MSDVILDWSTANSTANEIRRIQANIDDYIATKRRYEEQIEKDDQRLATLDKHKPQNVKRMLAKYRDLINLMSSTGVYPFSIEGIARKKADMLARQATTMRNYNEVITKIENLRKKLAELKQKAAAADPNLVITKEILKNLETTYGITKLTLDTSDDRTTLQGLSFVIDNPYMEMDWGWDHAPVKKGVFQLNYAVKVRLQGNAIYLQFAGKAPASAETPLTHSEWGISAHPHVVNRTTGGVCMGSFSELIQSGWRTRSLDALISICLQYTRMNNAADGEDYGGMHAHLWLQHTMPEGVERTLLHEEGNVKVYGIKGYYKDTDGNIRVNNDITYKFTIPNGAKLPDNAPVDPYKVIYASATTWKERGL